MKHILQKEKICEKDMTWNSGDIRFNLIYEGKFYETNLSGCLKNKMQQR